MNLLWQKIAQLEEEKQVHLASAVERDEGNVTIRKLQKKVERLQKELSVCRESNTDLKAKLADTSELQASAQLHFLVTVCVCFHKSLCKSVTTLKGTHQEKKAENFL